MADLYITNNVLGEDGLVPTEERKLILDGQLQQLMEADQNAQPSIDGGGS